MSDETRDVREWSDEKLLDILDEMAAKRWVVSSTDRDALREAARRLREGPDVREAYREVPDVERAFREGYGYGFDAGELGASYYGNRDTMDADEAWQESDARAALSEREREPGGSCRICGRPVSGVTICEYCDRMMEAAPAPGGEACTCQTMEHVANLVVHIQELKVSHKGEVDQEIIEAAREVLHYDHCDHNPPDPEGCTHCRLAWMVGFHGDVAEKGREARERRRADG